MSSLSRSICCPLDANCLWDRARAEFGTRIRSCRKFSVPELGVHNGAIHLSTRSSRRCHATTFREPEPRSSHEFERCSGKTTESVWTVFEAREHTRLACAVSWVVVPRGVPTSRGRIWWRSARQELSASYTCAYTSCLRRRYILGTEAIISNKCSSLYVLTHLGSG